MSEYIVEVRGPMHDVLNEEIVRCRDCRYVYHEEAFAGDVFMAERLWCMRPDGDGDYMRFEVEPDGFCKWGERK